MAASFLRAREARSTNRPRSATPRLASNPRDRQISDVQARSARATSSNRGVVPPRGELQSKLSYLDQLGYSPRNSQVYWPGQTSEPSPPEVGDQRAALRDKTGERIGSMMKSLPRPPTDPGLPFIPKVQGAMPQNEPLIFGRNGLKPISDILNSEVGFTMQDQVTGQKYFYSAADAEAAAARIVAVNAKRAAKSRECGEANAEMRSIHARLEDTVQNVKELEESCAMSLEHRATKWKTLEDAERRMASLVEEAETAKLNLFYCRNDLHDLRFLHKSELDSYENVVPWQQNEIAALCRELQALERENIDLQTRYEEAVHDAETEHDFY
eukprot:TRINITY_DN74291_c0_g1_i1.p1 TRINITY_DN74291_c0_g1~~TRINITY_DN74291_c0_g1_i1.p1  ORF type:complete len:348 (+),score=41.86 TRINITY_DN74291_c0_g1_i1:66-1046(+)